jgi:cyclase
MQIIDLSAPIDAAGWEPEPLRHEVLSPADGAKHMSEEMKAHFGLELDPATLPDCELLSIDTLTLTTHTGTHIDAPAHYGTKASYGNGTPRTIDQMPLDWFFRPGVVLDLTRADGRTVNAEYLARELRRIGYRVNPLDVVLLNTGAARRCGTPEYFSDFIGLDRSAVLYLLDLGVKVIGTDAFSLDAPFGHMIRAYQESGDSAVLWPAHFAGREREYCQIERLSGLDQLAEPFGFQVACFPVKITGAGAGWSRTVAIIDG